MSFQSPSKTVSLHRTLLATAVSAVLLATGPAWSQSSGSSMSGPGAGSTGTMGATGSSPKGMEPSTSAKTMSASKDGKDMKDMKAMKISKSDSKMLVDLAQGNMAEVENGKLALEKSPNADTKKFAQMMIDDHGKALGDIQKLAADKGVALPDSPSVGQKSKMTAMKALSGNLFDREYRKHAGVGDHESTVKLLKKIQKDAKDVDFKALATKMLPTVEGHLAEAKTLAAAKS